MAAHTAVRRIHVAALTVPLPAGWHWVVRRGNYRDCTNPIGVCSCVLPASRARQPRGADRCACERILLELSSLPIRSGARPWRRWRLSNHELQPARPVGPNRYAAVVELPSSPAVVASAWFGSIPAAAVCPRRGKSDPSKRPRINRLLPAANDSPPGRNRATCRRRCRRRVGNLRVRRRYTNRAAICSCAALGPGHSRARCNRVPAAPLDGHRVQNPQLDRIDRLGSQCG